MIVRFDDSLPQLIRLLKEQFQPSELEAAAYVRDATGRLAVFLDTPVPADRLEITEAKARATLGGYARLSGAIADATAPGAQRVLSEAVHWPALFVEGLCVHLIDRRIVGADWLRQPVQSSSRIPRVVFTSLKGGVGRSTALCVVAAHLSTKGYRVLALDLDLEAPGIGAMLMNEHELPVYGALDYLVENGISGVDSSFMADLIADSFLGSKGARVAVVPAIGRRTLENPGEALAKIARAYLEDVQVDGQRLTLSDQIREMVERFEATKAYDVILVDARAGLHETTAAAILALGANVLLFGVDQPQTFAGYKLLFGHLARFSINGQEDWRDQLQFVHAKASESTAARTAAAERFTSLYEILSQQTNKNDVVYPNITADDFDVEWNDNSVDSIVEEFSPPPVLSILDDTRYREFNPTHNRSLLETSVYSATFNDLIKYGDLLIAASEFSGT